MSVKKYIITADDIVDNLTSTDNTVPLSANQGRILNSNLSDASRITSGTINAERIPNLDASKITSGTVASTRLPAATTSALGAVKVGSGLSVSNGTISVSGGGSVNITNISNINNNGFKIGTFSVPIKAYSYTTETRLNASSWTNRGDAFNIASGNYTVTSIPPFICGIQPKISISPITIVLKKLGASTTIPINIRAVDNNGTVRGSTTINAVSTGDASGKLTLTLPTNWDYVNNTIQLQMYGGSTSSAAIPIYLKSITVTATTYSCDLFFAP